MKNVRKGYFVSYIIFPYSVFWLPRINGTNQVIHLNNRFWSIVSQKFKRKSWKVSVEYFHKRGKLYWKIRNYEIEILGFVEKSLCNSFEFFHRSLMFSKKATWSAQETKHGCIPRKLLSELSLWNVNWVFPTGVERAAYQFRHLFLSYSDRPEVKKQTQVLIAPECFRSAIQIKGKSSHQNKRTHSSWLMTDFSRQAAVNVNNCSKMNVDAMSWQYGHLLTFN